MMKICCFGEVLWDVFPKHRKIGGAPLNVALRLNSFQNDVCMISRIGKDYDGEQLLNYLEQTELNLDHVQTDEILKTGLVQVQLTDPGSATYDIVFPSAWDAIKLNKKLVADVKLCDAFVYGSLITRNAISNHTLKSLLEIAKYRVFDVNLRPPFYTLEVLKELMLKADFIKFNDEEITYICGKLGFESNAIEAQIKFISKNTNTHQICVTLGGEGAILFINNTIYENGGYKVEVQDTVGAGDSFLAALIHKLIHQEQPQKALDFACVIGAIVASKSGANPNIFKNEIVSLMG